MDEIITTVANMILREAEPAKTLAASGYAIFPFLGQQQIDALTEYYHRFQKEEPDHFYSSTHSSDHAFRKKTSEFIKETIAPLMPVSFKNYRLLGGAFVVKPPQGKGILQPHQDWNLVDESQTRSFNLWIPLTNVTVENGAVFVLPGSHARLQTYRGPGIPSLFKDVEQSSWNTLTPLPMQAGEALFYDHALLHGSPANTTSHIRLGIVCGVIPADADMQLCFASSTGIKAYRATEDFFMEQDPMAGPGDLTFIKDITSPYSTLSPENYERIFMGRQRKQSWLKRVFSRS